MTNEQIRIAMAEFCGWKLQQESDGEMSLIKPDGRRDISDFDPSSTFASFSYCFPDYPNDLNAVHEAESRLVGLERDKFISELCKVLGVIDAANPVNVTELAWMISGWLFATAAQRCEALLRTIGKWEEGKPE